MKKIFICVLLTILIISGTGVVHASELNVDEYSEEEYKEMYKQLETDCIYSNFEDQYFDHNSNIIIDFELRNDCLKGDYIWYKFTAPSNASYTFRTTGATDTYAEFFDNVVSGTTTFGRLYYDNDSGLGENFSKQITMSNGETIYLRVRGDNWIETGSFSIIVIDNGGIGFDI